MANVDEWTVPTSSGLVRGRAPGIWLGIPYAAPPVGARRYRPPAPPEPWDDVRDALAFGPSAPQISDGPFSKLVPENDVGRMDEDCLTLNIWAPTRRIGTHRPVMVWLPGGAFVTGGTSMPVYDGARLALEQRVVVVTVNYRIGVLGFLVPNEQLPGVATNCGLRDQLAALAWVRNNISGFGGDPANVTVFGESAGAGSIIHLLASDASGSASSDTSWSASGRAFDRAIVQSPGVANTLSTEQASTVSRVFSETMALAGLDPLTCPAEQLVEIQNSLAVALFPVAGAMPWHPAVDSGSADGPIVTGTPIERLAAGAGAGIPLVVCTTEDEMSLFLDPRAAALDDDRLHRWVGSYLRSKGLVDDAGRASAAALLVTAYRDSLGDEAPASAVWSAFQSDGELRFAADDAALAHSAHGPTWRASFTWRAAAAGLGACHAIDLPFTFGNLCIPGWSGFIGADGTERAGAERLSAVVRHAWAALATTGSPEVEGTPWPPFDTGTKATLLLGDQVEVVSDPTQARRASWP